MIIVQYKNADLTKYNDFLNSCELKCYDGMGTHKHHILPKFMGGSDDKENLIILSYEDHQMAHLILAKCFIDESAEYLINLKSAYKLNSWMTPIDLKLILSDLARKRLSGIGNPFYGKIHSEKSKQKMRDSHKKSFANGRTGNRLGTKQTVESLQKMIETKRKRFESGEIIPPMLNKKHTPESKLKMAAAKKLAIGSKSSRRIRVRHIETGLVFECIKDAGIYFKLSKKQIHSKVNKGLFIRLPKI